MNLSRSKIILIFVVALVACISVFYFYIYKSEPDVRQIEESTQSSIQDESQPDTTGGESSTGEEAGSTPKKQPQPTRSSVSDPPIVYTGYGHTQNDPLPKDQETSTTCTTSADTECLITFTNSSGDKVYLPAKETDSQGVAVWNWVGGDVGSGEWKVTATAGDKVSTEETIYIR